MSSRDRILLAGSVALACAFGACRACRADVVSEGSVQANCDADLNGPEYASSGGEGSPTSLASTASEGSLTPYFGGSVTQKATGYASGSVVQNSFHAYALATVSNTLTAPVGTGLSNADNDYHAGVTTDAADDVSDNLTYNGTVPGTFTATITLECSLSYDNADTGGARVYCGASMSIGGAVILPNGGGIPEFSASLNNVYDDGSVQSGPSIISQQQTFTLQPGQVLSVEGGVDLEASASLTPSLDGTYYRTGLSSIADAQDTGLFYIDAVTPGATLVSDSGFDYSTPAPEPTSLAIPAIFSLLLARSRRSRHSRTTQN